MAGEVLHPLGMPGNQWRVGRDTVDMCRAPLPPRRLGLQAAPQDVVLDAARTALLIVDMQNDFCTAGGWLDHIGVDYTPARAPIAPLARLLPAVRQAAMPVVWVNWGNRPDRANLSPSLLHVYKPSGTGVGLGDPVPGHGAATLERGSWGAAIVEDLAAAAGDLHVHKYRMSGFWDTELDSMLRNLGVTTLLFAGVNADQCVMATLQDASFLGYDCLLLQDCTATTSPPYCLQATLYNVKQCYGFVTDSPSLLEGLARLQDMSSRSAVTKRPGDYRAFRISPDDSNRLVIVFDSSGEGTPFITCVEIFDQGGRTPPNVHRVAHESFFVLRGRARATCEGRAVILAAGDSLLVPPGGVHMIENVGTDRLYLLTTMVPDEAFSELIRRGTPVTLDPEDLAVLAGDDGLADALGRMDG